MVTEHDQISSTKALVLRKDRAVQYVLEDAGRDAGSMASLGGRLSQGQQQCYAQSANLISSTTGGVDELHFSIRAIVATGDEGSQTVSVS